MKVEKEPRNPMPDRVVYLTLCALLLADALLLIARVEVGSLPVPMIGADKTMLVMSTLALVALGLRGSLGSSRAFLIGAIIGAFFFVRTLGLALLDPSHVTWLLREDWGQHYSGWAMFRATPWTWPPGLMPSVAYPVGTSIVYTDSLPLFALLFKPFSPLLPENFQYIGLWIFVSATMLGGFSALLVRRCSTNPAIVLAGAALVVYAPVFLNRIDHDTLTAHWLLLAAFWLYFRDCIARRGTTLLPWWALLAIASFVHPYLAAMSSGIYCAWLARRRFVERDLDSRTAIVLAVLGGAIVIAGWWLGGAFAVRFGGGSGGIPYGIYSLNVLAFVNSMGFSRLLPMVPIGQGQYEGFAYLGLGMLALVALLAVETVVRRRSLVPERKTRPLLVLTVAFLAFAVSTVIVIGPWTLLDLPLGGRLLGTFRGSGRFVWLAYYLLILFLIRRTAAAFGPGRAASVLATALAIQLWDFSWIHTHYARLRSGENWSKPEATLTDPRWDVLARGRKHLTLAPPVFCGKQAGPYLPFLLLAARHGMTVNTGYLARWNSRAENAYCNDFAAEIDRGERHPDELYVVAPDFVERFNAAGTPMRCETLDGYLACVETSALPTGSP